MSGDQIPSLPGKKRNQMAGVCLGGGEVEASIWLAHKNFRRLIFVRGCLHDIREIKFDVMWPYVKRQTAKMTSEFVFFSSNPSLNHIRIEKCLLLIATNTNIFTLLFNELKTDGKNFIFAVCRLTYDHVTPNLISLMVRLSFRGKMKSCTVFT